MWIMTTMATKDTCPSCKKQGSMVQLDSPIGKKLAVLEIKNGELTLKATVDPMAGASAGTDAATDTSTTGTTPSTATARTQ